MVGLQGMLYQMVPHTDFLWRTGRAKHGPLNTTIPPVSNGGHARMRPTSGLLVLALAS